MTRRSRFPILHVGAALVVLAACVGSGAPTVPAVPQTALVPTGDAIVFTRIREWFARFGMF